MFNLEPPVILVDGSYLLHRTYHAVPPMYAPDGTLTNAIYGTIKHIVSLLNDNCPQYMAVVIDRPEPSFRHKLSPKYKADRPDYAPEFLNQIPWVIAILEALGIAVVSIAGIEGDDALGTLATMASAAGEQVIIATADKDMMQLVNESITLEDTFKGSFIDREAVFQKFRVYPEHIADLLALMGDKSDGIVGVPGVGKISAANLIWEYGGIAGIIENQNSIPGIIGVRVREGIDNLMLDRKLTGIVTDMDLGVELSDLLLKATDTDKLKALYRELNFQSFF